MDIDVRLGLCSLDERLVPCGAETDEVVYTVWRGEPVSFEFVDSEVTSSKETVTLDDQDLVLPELPEFLDSLDESSLSDKTMQTINDALSSVGGLEGVQQAVEEIRNKGLYTDQDALQTVNQELESIGGLSGLTTVVDSLSDLGQQVSNLNASLSSNTTALQQAKQELQRSIEQGDAEAIRQAKQELQELKNQVESSTYQDADAISAINQELAGVGGIAGVAAGIPIISNLDSELNELGRNAAKRRELEELAAKTDSEILKLTEQMKRAADQDTIETLNALYREGTEERRRLQGRLDDLDGIMGHQETRMNEINNLAIDAHAEALRQGGTAEDAKDAARLAKEDALRALEASSNAASDAERLRFDLEANTRQLREANARLEQAVRDGNEKVAATARQQVEELQARHKSLIDTNASDIKRNSATASQAAQGLNDLSSETNRKLNDLQQADERLRATFQTGTEKAVRDARREADKLRSELRGQIERNLSLSSEARQEIRALEDTVTRNLNKLQSENQKLNAAIRNGNAQEANRIRQSIGALQEQHGALIRQGRNLSEKALRTAEESKTFAQKTWSVLNTRIDDLAVTVGRWTKDVTQWALRITRLEKLVTPLGKYIDKVRPLLTFLDDLVRPFFVAIRPYLDDIAKLLVRLGPVIGWILTIADIATAIASIFLFNKRITRVEEGLDILSAEQGRELTRITSRINTLRDEVRRITASGPEDRSAELTRLIQDTARIAADTTRSLDLSTLALHSSTQAEQVSLQNQTKITAVQALLTGVALVPTLSNLVRGMSEARTTARQAGTLAVGADTIARQANTTANQANATANQALSRANQAIPGRDGKDGEPGPPGKDGKPGPPGKDGRNGTPGLTRAQVRQETRTTVSQLILPDGLPTRSDDGLKQQDRDLLQAIYNQTKKNGSGINNNLNLSGTTLSIVNSINSTVGTVLTNLNKLRRWLINDRVINTLNFIINFHNAFMLSRNLVSSLGYMVDITLEALGFGLKDDEGNPVSINNIIGDSVQGLLERIFGASTIQTAQNQLALLNRIYQSGMNIIYTVSGLIYSVKNITETIGSYVGKIGNAHKRNGNVQPIDYGWMEEDFQGRIYDQSKWESLYTNLQNVEEVTSSIAMVSGEVVSIQQQAAYLNQSKEDFKELIEQTTAGQVTPDGQRTGEGYNSTHEAAGVAETEASATTASAVPADLDSPFLGSLDDDS